MKIIVTGSLGNISKPLTQQLVHKGHHVTVISSNPEKKQKIEAIGAVAAIGSLKDGDFLASTFTGANAVYAMVPPDHTKTDFRKYYQLIGNNYAYAIRQAGVKRVVYLSSYGAQLDEGSDLILGAGDVEYILNELANVSVTCLRPTYFYYNLFSFVDMIKHAGIIGSNYGGDDRLVMVSSIDIALVAAEELEATSPGKRVRYIASDDMPANEVAKVLGEAIGNPDLQWLTFNNEQTKDALIKNGLPVAFVNAVVDLGASIHKGSLQQDYYLHKPSIMGDIKLKDFANEFAATFLKNGEF